jgi:hypothetical protein
MAFKNSISVLKECPLAPPAQMQFSANQPPPPPTLPPPSPQLLLPLHIFLGKVTVEIGSYGCSIKRNVCLLLSVVIYLTIRSKKFCKKIKLLLKNCWIKASEILKNQLNTVQINHHILYILCILSVFLQFFLEEKFRITVKATIEEKDDHKAHCVLKTNHSLHF